LLNRDKDSFLDQWEINLTSREAKEKYLALVDFEKQKEKQKEIEKRVSQYIQANFSFVAIEVEEKEKRLEL
jgi:hypothetical protein